MKNLEVNYTAQDRAIMESYKSMLDGLAEYLGSGYELVLHSLEDLEHSAVKVINGYHTGRREGAPITELALSMLERMRRNPKQADSICYTGTNKEGHPLRSTTIAIRGNGRRIIGLLCINFYLDTPLSEFMNSFCTASAQKDETYVQDTGEMIRAAVENAIREVDEKGLADSPTRNREIVAQLYAAGIFNIKDAVNRVASALGISRNTVYLHLRNLRGED